MVNFRVKKLRKDRGWTLEHLSEMTGISISQLQRIEQNETMPTYDKICEIAYALNVPIEEVGEFHHTEKPQSG